MWAEGWGVAEGYHSAGGQWVQAPGSTLDAILATMGAAGDRPAPAGPVMAHPGESVSLDVPGVVATEGGSEVGVGGRLPPDLPLGYHWFHPEGGGDPRRVIVSPGRCLLPPQPTAWGWAVQLYGARSEASWGIGDLADLRRLAEWSERDLGAGFAMLNPLHAALPGTPQEASPYFPSTRRFRSPLYVRVEEVPGAASLGPELDRLARAGRDLNAARHIDRDAVWRLKLDALERLWEAFPATPDRAQFYSWRAAQDESLEAYATFCALSEQHGRPWTTWPVEHRHPASPSVREFRQGHGDRVGFQAWLQWLVHVQLEAAERALPVVHDLAVGFDAAGADGWQWQDLLAFDMSVGAPPDEFNTQGQDWGVPPFDPWRLRAAGYQPFVETLRASLRLGGGVRLDHVMGLFRLFWIPRGGGAAAGTYVRYPDADLLDIVALESHRAGAFVVGEDLGTVEDRARAELAQRGILSYKLLWFENDPPGWPAQSLGAVTTHDLATVAGLWSGHDLDDQRAAGTHPNEEGTLASRARLQAMTGVADEAEVSEVVAATYRVLGTAPCMLLAATLDDALAVEERPNMPGTTDQWPNWSLALPVPLEAVEQSHGPRAIAGALSAR